jgi:hypothetical protein
MTMRSTNLKPTLIGAQVQHAVRCSAINVSLGAGAAA